MSLRKKRWQRMYEEGEKRHLKRMKKEYGQEDVTHYTNIFVRSNNPDDIVQEPSEIEELWERERSAFHHERNNRDGLWTFFGCFGMASFAFMLFIIIILINGAN